MQAEEGYIYTYIIGTEAWYYQPLAAHCDNIMIGKDHVDGGCAWEFAVTEHDLGGPTLRTEMFGDSWDAFRDVPELFEALRTRVPRTFAELVTILDELGFVDVTPRVRSER